MKRVLFRIITFPLIVVLTVIEWVLKLTMRVGNVAAGLFINVLLFCIVIAIFNRNWNAFGLLVFCLISGMILIYSYATILYWIGEIKTNINILGK